MAIVENPMRDSLGMVDTNSKHFKELCKHQYMDSMYIGELDNGLLTVLIAFPHLSASVKASMGVRHRISIARAVVYDNGDQYLMLWHRQSNVAELYEVIWDPDEKGNYKIELSWMSKSPAYSFKGIYAWLQDYGHGSRFKTFAPRKSMLSRVEHVRCVFDSESLSSKKG